ncbi:50S ribosomal protein L11 methyltransferase [Flavimaricola sp.]|nr:50S ribosomal protein L11 methyltransferase [Flavimaricola sp.]MDA9020106.1 50S ribosomal protein L11 methyltransferase [Flavimaricola sp.]
MTAAHFFWPSDYSGMIVNHLRSNPGLAKGRRVCDIGTGSGILAATALHMGALDVVATDLDEDALTLARRSFESVSPDARFDLRQGSLWEPVASGTCFDLVLANLPNFPAEVIETDGRRATWSVGGADGRQALDPFLAGLPQRLDVGGTAIFTQNRCVGLGLTMDKLGEGGLVAKVLDSALVPVGPEKISALSSACMEPSGIVEVAGFVFLCVDLIVAEHIGRHGEDTGIAMSDSGPQTGANV